ncbi:hypothetical protein BSY238_860 [Methyloversatilis sp. RAC08]|uniref:hypothetical protein n=1 Tax=Methyloversatilis sp. RAC08 TaxID=1842540 RepID=UPI00083E3C48|nr:hypothetical protein [Methyloversatilis sp. RAC08]AOF82296.1 hypothetical protein BSY238_860 [Methyloversatilis sp. RAC08]
MKSCWISVAAIGLLSAAPAHAIDAKYARQLERSGCTQVSELQGCDITKTRAENAAAGFGTAAPAPAGAGPATPYAGQWVARAADGSTFATLRIDLRERVWVNGKRVKAKRSDGALVFRDGPVLFTIQGDRRLVGEDTWADFDAGTKGVIVAE